MLSRIIKYHNFKILTSRTTLTVEAYSGACQTSKMELKSILKFFTKISILHAWQGIECNSESLSNNNELFLSYHHIGIDWNAFKTFKLLFAVYVASDCALESSFDVCTVVIKGAIIFNAGYQGGRKLPGVWKLQQLGS